MADPWGDVASLWNVHLCLLCGREFTGSEIVVEAVPARSHPAAERAQWFHPTCWRTGLPGFREVARGRLGDVVEER